MSFTFRLIVFCSCIFILFLIGKNVGADFRETELIKEYTYDFSLSGGTSGTDIDFSTAVTGSTLMPSNAIITEVGMKVTTAFTSSFNPSITFGNSTSSAGYFIGKSLTDMADNAVFVADGGLLWDNTNKRKRLFLTDDTADRNIVMRLTSNHNISAGAAVIWVKYYTPSID